MSAPWLGMVEGGTLADLLDHNQKIHDVSNTIESFHQGDILQVTDQNLQLIAANGSALKRVLLKMIDLGIQPLHPPTTIAAAERFMQAESAPWNDSTLTDLQHLPFVTIDNEDSRDLDQALYICRESDQSYRVYYALADASWFVRPGTALFDEALQRGVTYYAPSFAARMLPALLSENLASLNPDVTRRALVFDMRLNSNGRSVETQCYRACIRSQAKLSYLSVQQFYDAAGQHEWNDAGWSDSLRLLEEVGNLRLQEAEERDVIHFNRRESQIVLDPADSTRLSVVLRERLNSELYNEQISLLCNMEGARLLQKLDRLTPELQAVYRVHLPPLKRRMAEFRERLALLIERRQLDSQWKPMDGESLADYVARLPGDGENAPLRQAIERMIMLTNRSSHYDDRSGPHHALGVQAYARFSSPMREVVGIFTHKELLEGLGLMPSMSRASDERLREQVIEQANESRALSRRLEKAIQLMAIEDFLIPDLNKPVGERRRFVSTVLGVKRNIVYLDLPGIALTIKIYLDELEQRFSCRYVVDDVSAVSTVDTAPAFLIGDSIGVLVRERDEQQRILFDMDL